MGAIGAVTITSSSIPAKPSGALALTLPSVESTRFSPYGLISFADIPELRGVLLANGVDPLRHVVTNVLSTGLLAPSAALTATPSAARAEAWLLFTGQPNDNDAFAVTSGLVSSQGTPSYVYFKTTIDPTKKDAFCVAAPANQVLIGANLAATVQNIYDFFNGVGSQGATWYNGMLARGDEIYDWPTVFDVTCYGQASGTTAKFRANTYGTVGNSYPAVEGTGTPAAVTNGSFVKKDGATATTVFADGASGTGTYPESGSYRYAYAYTREEDQAQSGLSPAADVTIGSAGQVVLTNAGTGPDDSDINRWYRTKIDGDTFWRGYDYAEGDAGDTDNVSDEDLDRFGNLSYDPTLYRQFEEGYPPAGRYVARFKGRYWTSGAHLAADTPSNASWTLTLTNGTRTATVPAGSLAYLTNAMRSRALTVTGAGLWYRIVRVDETTQTLYFDREWEGATSGAGGTAVIIRDDRNPYELWHSAPNLVNNWPFGNSLEAVRSPSQVGCTGMFPIWESLVVFTPTGVHRITGDGAFAAHQDAEGPGCLSGHSIVQVDGWLYWLGPDGFYEWNGAGMPTKISSPVVQPGGEVVGIDRTFARINLLHAHRSIGLYDSASKVIRWYVPGELDLRNTATNCDVTNRWAVVFDLNSRTFSLDTCEDVTYAATVINGDGSAANVTGDIQGALWHIDVPGAYSDGAFGLDSMKASASSTTSTLVASGSPLWTSALIGAPVWIMDASGNLTRAAVATGATGTITTRRQQTAPSDGAQMCPGGIAMDLETCWWHGGAPHLQKSRQRTRTYFDVQATAGQVFYATAKDQGTPTVRTGDTAIVLTTTDGERAIYVTRRGRHHKDRWLAVAGGFDCVLQGFRHEMSSEGG